MTSEQYFVVVPLFVGGLFSFIGAYWVVSTLRFVRAAIRTSGTVVSHLKQTIRRDEGYTTYYRTEIEFEDPTGKQRRVTLSQSIGIKNLREGMRVEVLIDPQNCLEVRLARVLDLWLTPLVCLLMGLFVFAIGVWVLCFGYPQVGNPM